MYNQSIPRRAANVKQKKERPRKFLFPTSLNVRVKDNPNLVRTVTLEGSGFHARKCSGRNVRTIRLAALTLTDGK